MMATPVDATETGDVVNAAGLAVRTSAAEAAVQLDQMSVQRRTVRKCASPALIEMTMFGKVHGGRQCRSQVLHSGRTNQEPHLNPPRFTLHGHHAKYFLRIGQV